MGPLANLLGNKNIKARLVEAFQDGGRVSSGQGIREADLMGESGSFKTSCFHQGMTSFVVIRSFWTPMVLNGF